MYHKIDHGYATSKLSVSPQSFRRQIEFIVRKNIKVISLEQLVDMSVGRTVAITFDDGFLNNYFHAFPVLKEYGMPSTIFIITDRIGGDNYVTWDQIREMAKNGVNIGSHTKSHRPLIELSEAEAREEIIGSKRTLEDALGMRIKAFSYPLGAFNDEIIDIVKRAGYSSACATNPPAKYKGTDPFSLRRIKITRTSDNLFLFSLKVSGYYTLFK